MSLPSLAPPGRKLPLGILLIAMLMPLFMALAYPASFISAMHRPVPHHLALEVIGTSPQAAQVAQRLSVGGGEALAVTTVPSADVARADVLGLRARAAYDPATEKLYVASAAGRQTALVVQNVVRQVAGSAVTVRDLKPPTQRDPTAIAFMYFVTGALTTGYIAATILSTLASGLRLRVKLGIQLLFSLIAGVVLPSILYGFYGIYTEHLLEVMAICAALFFTASVVQLGLAGLLGQLATPIGISLFVILGIPASGIAITTDMLPAFFNTLHRLLPSGAAEELLRRVLYFDSVDVGPWILQLLSWLLLGAGLLWAGRLGNVEHSQAEPTAGLVSEGLEKIRNHPEEPVLTAYKDDAAVNAPALAPAPAVQTLAAAPAAPISAVSSVPASPVAVPPVPPVSAQSLSARPVSALSRLSEAPPASAGGALQNPGKPPARPVNESLTRKRMLTAGMIFPLFMMVVMPLLMTGTMTNIAPRDMNVAVIGTGTQIRTTARQLDTASVGRFNVTTVPSAGSARAAVSDHTLRAAYDPASGDLYTAGADGNQVTGAVQAFFTPVAQRAGKTLNVRDVVPLKKEDPLGATVLYLALGAILGGFMTGIILSLMPVSSRARIGFGLAMPAAVATAMVIYGWAVFGIFSGSAAAAWAMLYLLSLTCLTVTTGLMLLFGPAVMPIAIVLSPLIGMSTSGVSASLDMVNSFYGNVHSWVFSSQGISALRDALYFPNVSLTQPVLIMLAWFAAGLALAVIGTVRQKRRHLFAMMRKEEEARTVVAVGAAVL